MWSVANKAECYECAKCKCYKDCPEFKKVAEFKKVGLDVYLHNKHSSDDQTDRTTAGPPDSHIKKDVFILHNTSDANIVPADFVSAFDINNINCLRCRHIAKNIQNLLQGVHVVDKKTIRGVCHHCMTMLRSRRPCYECQKIAAQFAGSPAMKQRLEKFIDKTHRLDELATSKGIKKDLHKYATSKVEKITLSEKRDQEKIVGAGKKQDLGELASGVYKRQLDQYVPGTSGRQGHGEPTIATTHKRSGKVAVGTSTRQELDDLTTGTYKKYLDRFVPGTGIIKDHDVIGTGVYKTHVDKFTPRTGIQQDLDALATDAYIFYKTKRQLNRFSPDTGIRQDLDEFVTGIYRTQHFDKFATGRNQDRSEFVASVGMQTDRDELSPRTVTKKDIHAGKLRLATSLFDWPTRDKQSKLITTRISSEADLGREIASTSTAGPERDIEPMFLIRKKHKTHTKDFFDTLSVREEPVLLVSKKTSPQRPQKSGFPDTEDQHVYKSEDFSLQKIKKLRSSVHKTDTVKFKSTPDYFQPEKHQPVLKPKSKMTPFVSKSSSTVTTEQYQRHLVSKSFVRKHIDLKRKERKLSFRESKATLKKPRLDLPAHDATLSVQNKTAPGIMKLSRKSVRTLASKQSSIGPRPAVVKSVFKYEFYKKSKRNLARHISSTELLGDIKDKLPSRLREKAKRRESLGKKKEKEELSKEEEAKLMFERALEEGRKRKKNKGDEVIVDKHKVELQRAQEKELELKRQEQQKRINEMKAEQREINKTKKEVEEQAKNLPGRETQMEVKLKQDKIRGDKTSDEMKDAKKEAKTRDEKTKEDKSKEQKIREQNAKEEKTKEGKIKEHKTVDEKIIEDITEEGKIKEAQTKEEKSQEMKTQEAKTLEEKIKADKMNARKSKEQGIGKTDHGTQYSRDLQDPETEQEEQQKMMKEYLERQEKLKEEEKQKELLQVKKVLEKQEAEKQKALLEDKRKKEKEDMLQKKRDKAAKLETATELKSQKEEGQIDLSKDTKPKKALKEKQAYDLKALDNYLRKEQKELAVGLKLRKEEDEYTHKVRQLVHNKFQDIKTETPIKLAYKSITDMVKPGAIKAEQIRKASIVSKSDGQYVELPFKSIRLRATSLDHLIHKLVSVKQGVSKQQGIDIPTAAAILSLIALKHFEHDHGKTSTCLICSHSDLELELLELAKEMEELTEPEVIIGNEVLPVNRATIPIIKMEEDKGLVPLVFKSIFKAKASPDELTGIQLEEQVISKSSKAKSMKEETFPPKGIIRYALSDRTFIDKGWTMLPTEKVVRKMNIYRMRPARPEFDWFAHNKKKGFMRYDDGHKLAEFDDNGRGRWYYRNGRLALDYYNAEELNAQQRYVVHSSGEPDARGRSQPLTILATFDYLGNGVVFDHSGKIRLKYNQTEGILLDRGIGPVTHWKWHSLNDPPELRQVMIDTKRKYKDPAIMEMENDKEYIATDQEDMLAIEFENYVKERSNTVKRSNNAFKPYQIKMKALKINKYFSLRVADQTNIYLTYKDGSTNLKLNLGMVLDHREVIDTNIDEVGNIATSSVVRYPAETDSVAQLHLSLANAQKLDRGRTQRDQWLRPTPAVASADQLVAATSRPLRPPLQTTKSGANCVCKRKAVTSNLYYNTRIV